MGNTPQGRKENVTQTHIRCILRSNLCADSTSLSVAARGMLPDSLSSRSNGRVEGRATLKVILYLLPNLSAFGGQSRGGTDVVEPPPILQYRPQTADLGTRRLSSERPNTRSRGQSQECSFEREARRPRRRTAFSPRSVCPSLDFQLP